MVSELLMLAVSNSCVRISVEKCTLKRLLEYFSLLDHEHRVAKVKWIGLPSRTCADIYVCVI